MKKITLILLVLTLATCSRINRESRDYYQQNNNPVRHGIVPLSQDTNVTNVSTPEPLDEKAIVRGETVYQQNCQSCHGINATGNGPKAKKLQAKPRNLVTMAKEVPYFKFYIMVSRWQGEMPGWKNVLTEKEVSDLEQYIRSLALNK
jgi:mono/diheme cytochrome c family protein